MYTAVVQYIIIISLYYHILEKLFLVNVSWNTVDWELWFTYIYIAIINICVDNLDIHLKF